jgi:hypothetical protein
MRQRPQTIKGTNRQIVTTADGTAMQRAYVYLPSHVWHALQELARAQGVSVSQAIQTFALGGNVNSKVTNVEAAIRSN